MVSSPKLQKTQIFSLTVVVSRTDLFPCVLRYPIRHFSIQIERNFVCGVHCIKEVQQIQQKYFFQHRRVLFPVLKVVPIKTVQ